MKKLIAFVMLTLTTLCAVAADLKTIVFTPEPAMVCQNCEAKIKKNLRFVKGTKNIETSLEHNTVTITYDPRKTNLEDYVKAFEKIGREVTLPEEPQTSQPDNQSEE